MRDGRIEYLIQLVEKSDIAELEIWERWGEHIRIAKRPGSAPVAAPVPATSPSLAPAAAPATAAQPPTAEIPPPVEEDANLVRVVSPMVGTFFRASAPEAPPFVEVGSLVAPGQTLCIIEAMKLMNEITSEVAGSVRKILVENAQPVEFGQVLFLIEKSA
jgi:acetyl-CoA carboxylase biotin carboxyl carrier protein